MSSAPRHRRGLSLRARLTLAFAAVFAVALGAVFLVLDKQVRHAALKDLDAILVSEARRLMDLAGRRKARILQSEIDRMEKHHGTDRVMFVLAAASGERLAQTRHADMHDRLLAVPVADDDDAVPVSITVGSDRLARALHLRAPDGTQVAMALAAPGIAQGLAGARALLATAYGTSLALATVLAWLVTRAAIRRIEEVRRAAEALAGGDLTRRLPAAAGGDEIVALSRTFNRMIERIAGAIDQLGMVTTNLAHDYRAPLARMRAAAELALDAGDEQARLEALASVVEECDRMDRMSANLLKIARLEGGADRPAEQPVDLRTLVAEAANLFGPCFADKDVHLDCAGLPEVLMARADPALMERVVANLLDNALKYTPAGGLVQVTGTLGEGRIQIVVSDTGPGIPGGDLERVFDRFYRSPCTATDGAGLGLSFARAALRALGGSIRAEPNPGGGARFVLELASASGADRVPGNIAKR